MTRRLDNRKLRLEQLIALRAPRIMIRKLEAEIRDSEERPMKKIKKESYDSIKRMLMSKKTLECLGYMAKQLQIFNTLNNNLKGEKRNKDERSMAIKAIAQLLKLDKKSVHFFRTTFVSNAARSYFTGKLIEATYATPLWPETMAYKVFDGKHVKRAYNLQAETMKIKNVVVEVKPHSVRVKYKKLEFLLFPGGTTSYHDHEKKPFDGVLFVACNTKDLKEVTEAMEELDAQFDPIKNSVVTFGNELEIIELKEKFQVDQVIVTSLVREEIELIANMFKNHKSFIEKGVPFKRGVLFAGEPGTGKTTITNALTRRVIQEGGTVFVIAGQALKTDLVYKYVNRFKPVLIIFEDFDLMAGTRETDHGAVDSGLLNVLEGSLGVDGVITVGTTNRLEVLDPAAIRHGRIDKIYPMALPNTEMKLELLKLHMDFYKVPVDLSSASAALKPFLSRKNLTGAAISSIILSARQRAAVKDRDVLVEDLKWASNDMRKSTEDLGFQIEKA